MIVSPIRCGKLLKSSGASRFARCNGWLHVVDCLPSALVAECLLRRMRCGGMWQYPMKLRIIRSARSR
jgi:hypothetical protein